MVGGAYRRDTWSISRYGATAQLDFVEADAAFATIKSPNLEELPRGSMGTFLQDYEHYKSEVARVARRGGISVIPAGVQGSMKMSHRQVMAIPSCSVFIL